MTNPRLLAGEYVACKEEVEWTYRISICFVWMKFPRGEVAMIWY
jgi:hypothetical protein